MKRTRKLPTLLAGVAALVLTSQVSAQAKDPEVYFYPAKSWSTQKTGPNCSIASEFNNGFILRFDGTQQWVDAVSINFRQDLFDAGTHYDMTLQVPGIKNQSFSARSTDAQTIRASLKNKKDFFKSLRTASVLDMNLDGNEFRFYLTGFATSALEFERCMAGGDPELTTAMKEKEETFRVNEAIAMEEQVKSGETPAIVEILPEDPKPVVQEIPVAETRKLGDTILETNVENIAQEPATRKRLSEQLAEQINSDPSLIDAGASTSDEQPEALPASETLAMPPQMDELPLVPVMEVEEPKAIEVLEEPKAATSTMSIGEEQKEASLSAEDIISAKPKAMDTIEAKGAVEIEPEAVEVAPVEAKTVKMSTPPMKVHKQVAKAEADFTNLNEMEPSSADETAKMSQSDPGTYKRMREMEKMVATLKAENKALNEELATSLKESEDERMTIASDNWNLEQATMRFNEAERQIKRMGQQLQRERAKCKAEKQDLEAMLFDPQVTDQQQLARLAELEDQLAQAQQELEDQRMRYEEHVKTNWENGAP